jgi:hypothetical protein
VKLVAGLRITYLGEAYQLGWAMPIDPSTLNRRGFEAAVVENWYYWGTTRYLSKQQLRKLFAKLRPVGVHTDHSGWELCPHPDGCCSRCDDVYAVHRDRRDI